MLHELLLALVGLPGDVIAPRLDHARGREVALRVAADVPWVGPAERQLLDRLAKLGFHYRRLERFVGTFRGAGGAPGGARAGLYVRALSGGLEELLDGYRARVLQAEQDALAAAPGPFPLPRLLHDLALYVQVFPALHALVDDAEAGGGLHGGELLQLLRTRAQAGVPAVRRCMQRLLFHCHRVLFNQVGSWVVNGMLTDPHGEFFIRRARLAAAPADDAEEASAAPAGGADHALARGRWNEQYELNLAMLPASYVPVQVARQVLFIGRAVNLLQHPAVQRLGSQLLPHADALAIAQAVHTLRQQPAFDLLSVRLALDEMRAVVTRHLWQLVVVRGRLAEHLAAIKNYFLVGRGEFFQAFLDAMDARGLFDAPPTSRAERDVNDGPFQAAAAACGVDDDEHFRRLSVRLDQSSFAFEHFTRRHVRTHASAASGCTVVVGGADLDERRRRLVLTGPGARDIGAAWHSSRKVLDQGFVTRFVVSAQAEEGGGGGGGAGGTPAAAEPLPLPWVASGHGFSFVVQNHGMAAVPEVTFHPAVASPAGGAPEANTVANHAGAPVVARYEAVPNSVEVYFHLGGGGGGAGSYAGVFARPAGADASAAPERLAFVPASRAPALASLARGGEHAVTVEYAPPRGSSGDGVLRVSVAPASSRAAAAPLLEVPFSLGLHVRLDSGRGWVGLTAATGFAPRGGGGERRSRTVSSWRFNEAASLSSAAWRQLGLEYRVQAPLDLVLLPDDFDRYNALFRFLFLVKRVQSALQSVWPWQGRTRKLDAARRRALTPVFALRANMQFLVDSLQYYLHVDVVEAQFARLEAAVRDSKDFETVRRSHEEYLSALSRYCFLHARVMSRALHRIFDLCFEFCRVVRARGADVDPRQVARLSRDFRLQASFLFTVLSRKASQYSSPHLAQLVLRMDFNRFWTSQAAALGVDRGGGGV